jgi:hypothetical protein
LKEHVPLPYQKASALGKHCKVPSKRWKPVIVTLHDGGVTNVIKSELLKEQGVLIVSPVGTLAASDFEHLAEEIDPYIEQNGRLHGLMVHTEFFPRWADFAALISHLKFVRDHQSKIEKVAAVSDSGFLRIIPSVASHFVKAEVKHFYYNDKDKALEWLVSR